MIVEATDRSVGLKLAALPSNGVLEDIEAAADGSIDLDTSVERNGEILGRVH